MRANHTHTHTHTHLLTHTHNTHTLTEEDDLTDITEAMQDVASNFPLIGTALHLMSGDVKIIRKECVGDYRSGLEQVILMWLKQNYNVDRFGEPTWRKVVQVVDKPNGGNNHALAKKIAAAHQGDQLFFLFISFTESSIIICPDNNYWGKHERAPHRRDMSVCLLVSLTQIFLLR